MLERWRLTNPTGMEVGVCHGFSCAGSRRPRHRKYGGKELRCRWCQDTCTMLAHSLGGWGCVNIQMKKLPGVCQADGDDAHGCRSLPGAESLRCIGIPLALFLWAVVSG
jgi:hypothetical protein